MNNYEELFGPQFFAGLIVFIIIFLIIWVIAVTFKIVSRWIYFKKCGEVGWKALIPVYTDITLLKTSGLNWWWIFPLYISVTITVSESFMELLSEMSGGNYTASILVGILAILSLFSSLIVLLTKFNIGYNITKKFNKEIYIGILIMFFEPIMLLVIGLSKNFIYDKDKEVSPNGVIGEKKYTSSSKYCNKCGTKLNSTDQFCGNCGNKMR